MTNQADYVKGLTIEEINTKLLKNRRIHSLYNLGTSKFNHTLIIYAKKKI